MNELALFAGAGGGILGGPLLGWNTVGAVEIEEYPRQVLLARQRDGLLPTFPIWDDVCTFDGRPWRGLVDVVSGGFPCQDISSAGRGAGITGERSGLWREMFRIIREVRPRFAFMENSPMLTSRGLGTVLGDLAEAGFDAEWMVLGAHSVGAPHRRDRIWILASPHPDTHGLQCSEFGQQHQGPQEPLGSSSNGVEAGPTVADSDRLGLEAGGRIAHDLPFPSEQQQADFVTECGEISNIPDGNLSRDRWRLRSEISLATNRPGGCEPNAWWATEPDLGRVAHGVAHKMDRLKAIGNGQVPLVAATAFLELKRRLEK